ncbi:SLC13 family permease [Halovibrio sp. HP20-50]|uniref:SLC13 family permease n=1 Tax=Halovibrio sp. HP20-59 TaxID=3080275 RepID=UPI00294B90A7|nr:SLC13 family permease [Halovibrio sp. HP20-59]MEA2120414.1 SLC13 family permease [Halovibrio sp. HP20-59]
MTAWAVLFSIAVLLALLISGRVKPAIAFVTLAGIFLLAGLVDTATLLAQYTNPALATLLLLLMVSLALERSPLLGWLSQHLLKGHPRLATARLMGSTAVLSAFLNNTAVVAAFLGAISRQQRIAPSRLLIPLSYASILGGITTLVGTSTNLVVNSFHLSASGSELGMFQFSWVGIPVALITLCMLMWRANALPFHALENTHEKLAYFLAADLEPSSPMVGKSIEENGLRSLDGLYLLEIERHGRLISPVAPDEQLHANDTLVFTGEVGKVQALQRFPGLQLFGHQADNLLATNLVEVVISHESELSGKTLQNVDFRSMFSAGVVGIRRGEKRLEGQLGKIPLRVGDCLLLAVSADFRQHRNLDRNFHLLSGSFTRPHLSHKESLFTVGGFATVITLATANLLPLFHGLLLLLGGLLLIKVISLAELRRRFPFELWLIIGSALAIAQALENSGAAGLLATGMQSLFSGYGIYAAFIGCYLLTLLLTETVTNNAAAALAFPIAWSTALAFGADPLPFVMAVAYGASACFLIPFGYQTHLMVYSPGRYRITDFLKIGLPVSATYSAAVLVITPLAFPF